MKQGVVCMLVMWSGLRQDAGSGIRARVRIRVRIRLRVRIRVRVRGKVVYTPHTIPPYPNRPNRPKHTYLTEGIIIGMVAMPGMATALAAPEYPLGRPT